MFYWRCQHWRQNVFFNWLELSDVMIKSHIWMNKSWHVLWTLFQITQSFSFVFVFSKRIEFGSHTVTRGCKKFATFASEWRDEFAKEKWGKKAVAPSSSPVLCSQKPDPKARLALDWNLWEQMVSAGFWMFYGVAPRKVPPVIILPVKSLPIAKLGDKPH